MNSILIKSQAPGCNWLEREVKLYAGEPFVGLQNRYDKVSTKEKEGIHFGFTFDLPDAIAHVDAPWSVITPEKEQLPAANRNWMAFERWVDISNSHKGVTWTSLEAPLIQWEDMDSVILDGARQADLWKKKIKDFQKLFSWPLNNHWDTNFPLEQGGIIKEQYAVSFHDGYNVAAANRFGMEQHRPLVAVKSKVNLIDQSPFSFDKPGIIVSSITKTNDEECWIITFRSFSDKKEELKLNWGSIKPESIFDGNADGPENEVKGNELVINPYGIKMIYVKQATNFR
ncbi:hypothetical protein [Niabella ginsengisoli]|uniref:Uncharacterized protein n=1 Tax=Niabella ginsengisoli TaxID=522298 RepID=A0ABS9SKT6_9BACT|nr:hypothetical protein [Niabella ginsengisoli]MCH5598952.1 hypothetical protein [Niabella ginsengisoli]